MNSPVRGEKEFGDKALRRQRKFYCELNFGLPRTTLEIFDWVFAPSNFPNPIKKAAGGEPAAQAAKPSAALCTVTTAKGLIDFQRKLGNRGITADLAAKVIFARAHERAAFLEEHLGLGVARKGGNYFLTNLADSLAANANFANDVMRMVAQEKTRF
ncbi:unnamed protein product, partial [Mesorhabditis spiculigera]